MPILDWAGSPSWPEMFAVGPEGLPYVDRPSLEKWLHSFLVEPSFQMKSLKKIYYLFLTVLGLHCCVQVFSNCNEQGQLSSCSALASCCSVFSYWRAQAVGAQASVVVVHGLVVAAHGLWSSGWVLWHMGFVAPCVWDLPGPGIKPMSPALAGRFLNYWTTTETLK